MSENFIHIDEIAEDRDAQGGVVVGSSINIRLDGVSQIAIVSILSSLITDLGIDLKDISRFRRIVSETCGPLECLSGEKAEDEA